MKADQKFNKRSAPQIECTPTVQHGRGDPLGVCATLFPTPEQTDHGNWQLHMTPSEAIEFGLALIAAGHARLKITGKV